MDSNTIIAAATCAQAAVLVIAAVVAMRQVKEARRLREEQAQPYVVVSLETDPSSPFILNLAIRNLGHTAARNVVVDFDPPLVSSLDPEGVDRVAEWTVLKDGILTLAPGQSMSTMLDSLLSRYTDEGLAKLPRHVKASVTYMGDHGRDGVYSYEYDLDFSIFYGSHYVGRKTFDDLVKAVDEIRRTISSWTTDGGARVYVKDLEQVVGERYEHWHQHALAQKVKEISQGRDPAAPAESPEQKDGRCNSTSPQSASADGIQAPSPPPDDPHVSTPTAPPGGVPLPSIEA